MVDFRVQAFMAFLSSSYSGIFARRQVLQLLVIAGLSQSCAGIYEQAQVSAEVPSMAPPTPIEMTRFSVEPTAAAVQLQWQTEIELGCAYFAVERSTDKIRFVTIGEVEGNDLAVTPTQHQFVDQQPLRKTVYYRLRQVDLDGAEHLGPVRSCVMEPVASARPKPAHL